MNKAICNNIFSFTFKKKVKGFMSFFLRKSRNEILKKNTELNKLRLAFEQTPSAIFILDKNFRFEYVNSSFVSLSGYSKEELLNRTVGELFYRNDLPELNNDIVKGLLNGEKWEGELLTYNKNGLTYWANTIAAPYKDGNGSVEGYIIIQQDTTERRKMEVSLKESEQFYRTLIENSMEAIALTQNGKFILVNSAFFNLFGYTNDEIFRMDPQSFIAPEDRDRVMDMHYKRMRGEIAKQNYKASFIHKSGKRILTQLNASTIQLHGENASFITLSDITERTAMEIALRESEMKYRELAEMLPLAVYEHDLNGILTYLNKSGRVKFGIDSLEQPICAFSLIQADDLERIRSNMSNNMSENLTSSASVYTAIRTNGEKFPVMIFASAVISEGKKIGTRGIFMDMTEHLAIENALRVSEKKYRELADMLPQAIYELDANGIPTYLNKAGIKAFGIDKGVTNKKAFDFFIPNDVQRMKTSLNLEAENLVVEEGNISAQPSEPAEFTVKRADGSTFPVLIYGTSIVENGKVVGSRGMIVDISDRKAMENALRESESKYKTLIENSQNGIFAIVDDKILFANKTFCKLLGYTSDELSNKLAISLVLPDDRVKGLAISERRRQGDHSTVNDIFHFIAKDGSIKEGDVFSSVLELNGQVVSYITVHDLTETRKIQEDLRQSEEKYRSLIENATDGIVIVQNGILKFANQTMCDIMKYPFEELIEKPFLNYIDKKDHELLTELHARRMVGEQFSSILRSKFIRKDTKMITVELNARTSNYNGSPAGFVIIRDITERLKIENELQNAKSKLELLNSQLEKRIKESSESLTEAQTQLINLQKENLQSQFDVLKQQVNPHFLFNSLNVLTSLIKLEPDLAEKFSEQLSKVYRYVLENKDNELVDLNTELNFLDAYIFLLNIRFVDKLRVNINIPEAKRRSQIIPLAMQLLIENAIKHNIMSKSEPLNIDVFIDSENFLNIINNLQARPSQLVSTGVGLKNIQNRYMLLNNTEPIFEKTNTHFIAKVPLVIFE